MQIISTIALISINETMVVQLVSFLIFLFVINRVMFRPINRAISERHEYVDRIRSEIAESVKRLAGLNAEMEEHQENVRREAHAINRATEQNAQKEAFEIFEQAMQEIKSIKEEAALSIQSQLEEATGRLSQEAESISLMIMEKILGRRLGT